MSMWHFYEYSLNTYIINVQSNSQRQVHLKVLEYKYIYQQWLLKHSQSLMGDIKTMTVLKKNFWNCLTLCRNTVQMSNVEVGKLQRQAQIAKQIMQMSDEKSKREHQKAHSVYFCPCKYMQNITNMLWTDSVPLINSSVGSVWYRRVVAKYGKIRIDDCWMVLGHLDIHYHDNRWTGNVTRRSSLMCSTFYRNIAVI